MPRITKVYTRQGDDGTTSLGGGTRVKKNALRVEAFGTVDELNARIGVALAGGLDGETARILREVQNELFHLGADLCTPEKDKKNGGVPTIEQRHVDALEEVMDRLNADLGPLENFILPGGSLGAAQLQVSRAICRRAEREVVALSKEEEIGQFVIPYLNRLSDILFLMARYENQQSGTAEPLWDSLA